MKTFWMLDKWQDLSYEYQRRWVDYIHSYQRTSESGASGEIETNAYIDESLINCLRDSKRESRITYKEIKNLAKKSVKGILGRHIDERYSQSEIAVIADTKQALATLAQIGEFSSVPYSCFPNTVEDIKKWVFSFDWRYPWSAGGKTAALAVFLSLEAPRLIDEKRRQELIQGLCACYEDLAVPKTGGYYIGKEPTHGMLVNGAMKVLTALDWISEPVHYSTQLIDTTLSQNIQSDGCHLVDAVYVLYRCSGETEYRRQDIKEYFIDVLKLIRRHYNSDGGFSYNVGAAQRWYYGIPISHGLNESDMHGTVLLTWALSMITEVLYPDRNNWRVIRP